MELPVPRASTVRLMVAFIILVLYLIIGAGIFSLIEDARESETVTLVRSQRKAFLDSHPCIADEELENFIHNIIDANNRGVSAIRNVTMEPNWSFGQSFFFAGTVLTTIGYGHVAPLSDGGKAFCIVFAVIGIPLTLIAVSALVERLLIPVKKISEYLHDRLSATYQSFTLRLLHLVVVVVFMLVFMFLIPSAIFASLEPSWGYFDAFYYCFISLTTVGLGDYIPGDHPDQRQRALYKVMTTFYLFIGLTFMMLLIAIIYQNPELNLGRYLSLKSDAELKEQTERVRLRTMPASGPNYTQHVDEPSPDDRVNKPGTGDTNGTVLTSTP